MQVRVEDAQQQPGTGHARRTRDDRGHDALHIDGLPDVVITPDALRHGDAVVPLGNVHRVLSRWRYTTAWRGWTLVALGLSVAPLILYMPCITLVSFCFILVGLALAVAAQPTGHALVICTRRGEFELLRHPNKSHIEPLRQQLAIALKLESPPAS